MKKLLFLLILFSNYIFTTTLYFNYAPNAGNFYIHWDITPPQNIGDAIKPIMTVPAGASKFIIKNGFVANNCLNVNENPGMPGWFNINDGRIYDVFSACNINFNPCTNAAPQFINLVLQLKFAQTASEALVLVKQLQSLLNELNTNSVYRQLNSVGSVTLANLLQAMAAYAGDLYTINYNRTQPIGLGFGFGRIPAFSSSCPQITSDILSQLNNIGFASPMFLLSTGPVGPVSANITDNTIIEKLKLAGVSV